MMRALKIPQRTAKKAVSHRLDILLVYVILTSLAFAGTGMVDGHQNTELNTRVFHSGDKDFPDADGNSEDLSSHEVGRRFDIVFPTTRPQFTIKDLGTYTDIRLDRAMEIENKRSPEFSYYFASSSSRKSSGAIKDAHVTIMGVTGGGQPTIRETEGSHERFAYRIGSHGNVLNVVDYRIEQNKIPDDYCQVTEKELNDDGNVTDATRLCYEWYAVHNRTYRNLTIDSKKWSTGGNGKRGATAISFTGASSRSRTRLTVEANIRIRIKRIKRTYDWSPSEGVSEPTLGEGEWELTEKVTTTERFDQVTVSDSMSVVVDSSQELTATQWVIDAGEDQKHLILRFHGPGTDDDNAVSTKEFENRKIWSRIVLSDRYVIRSGWSVYSNQQYGGAWKARRGKNPRTHLPHLYRTYIHPTQKRPAVGVRKQLIGDPSYQIGHDAPIIEGWTAQSISVLGKPNPGTRVNLSSHTPVAYKKMLVMDSQSPAQYVETVTGERIPVQVTKRIAYIKPEVKIEPTDTEGVVKITVRDSKTHRWLSGQRLSLIGTNREEVTTGANGQVLVSRESPVVQVTVLGDDWTQPCKGDVGKCRFIGRVKASKHFHSAIFGVGLWVDLSISILFATPWVLIYIYWRDLRDL